MQQLVEAGANVDAKDSQSKATPLRWAEYFVRESSRPKQYSEIAEYLRLKDLLVFDA